MALYLMYPERTVRDWLSRIDKDTKPERDKRIFGLWLACWTQEEIAESVGTSKRDVSEVCSKMADLPNLNKPSQAAASHATDFDVPIYNIWKQQEKTAGSTHCSPKDDL